MSPLNDESIVPRYAAFQVTSRCNWHCAFCFSKMGISELNTGDCKRIIHRLAQAGVKMISIAGREPLLRPDIPELTAFIRKCGCEVVIETNGSLLDKNLIKLIGAAWLSFSVDSISEKLCQVLGRGYLDSSKIQEIIDSSKLCGTKVKVNTVVSQLNYDHIIEIGDKMLEVAPTVWKLRQFTAREGSAKVKNTFELSLIDFEQIVSHVREQFTELNIESKTSEEQSRTCFMIWPDGRIVIPEGETHRIIGHALEDSIQKIWLQAGFDSEIHYRNVERTYKHRTNDSG